MIVVDDTSTVLLTRMYIFIGTYAIVRPTFLISSFFASICQTFHKSLPQLAVPRR